MSETNEQALRVLTSQYGFQDPDLRPLGGGTGGSLKAIHLAEENGRRYVLKRYRSFRSFADLTAIHEAQGYLSQRGIPVAPVIRNRDGLLVSATEVGNWVLYDWMDGRHPVPKAMTVYEAAVLGEMLGQLHAHLAAWPTDWAGAEQLEAYPAAERIGLYEELLRHAERGRTQKDELCRQVLRHAIGGLERMSGLAPRLLGLERQWVHGDPNEGNILYHHDRDQVLAFIDFDNMRLAPRGFDFMYALASCFPVEGEARDAYARAYLRTARPAPDELELWAPLWAYRELCDIWPIDVYYLDPAACDPAWRIHPPSDRWERAIEPITEWLLRLSSHTTAEGTDHEHSCKGISTASH